MATLFEVGDDVVEVMGTGEDATRVHTKIARITSPRVCQTASKREYDRLTGAAVPAVKGYRAIHTFEKFRIPAKELEGRS